MQNLMGNLENPEKKHAEHVEHVDDHVHELPY